MFPLGNEHEDDGCGSQKRFRVSSPRFIELHNCADEMCLWTDFSPFPTCVVVAVVEITIKVESRVSSRTEFPPQGSCALTHRQQTLTESIGATVNISVFFTVISRLSPLHPAARRERWLLTVAPCGCVARQRQAVQSLCSVQDVFLTTVICS